MIRALRSLSPAPLRSLTVFALALLLGACGGPTGPGGGFTPPDEPTRLGFAGNRSGTLDGVPYGDGAAGSDALRRVVPARVEGETLGFSVGDATLVRGADDAGTEFIEYVVPVRNDDAASCFVQAQGLTFADADGNAIYRDAAAVLYVTGSVAALGDDRYSGTCLDFGETGYLLGLVPAEEVPFDAAAAFVVDAIEADASDIARPSLALALPSYQTTSDTAPATILIDVRNEGGVLATLGETSQYVRLDADGDPYGWSFLLEPTVSELPSGEAVAYRDEVTFAGRASGLRAYIDAEPSANAALRAPDRPLAATGPDLSRVDRWRLRNARAAALEEAVRLERDR